MLKNLKHCLEHVKELSPSHRVLFLSYYALIPVLFSYLLFSPRATLSCPKPDSEF